MLDKVKISIDVMGGDNSPDKTLEGLNLFIKRNQNISDYIFYSCYCIICNCVSL